MSSIKLFLLFTKIGAILLGGGYVILPILQNELIEKRNLINHEELINYYAISQSMPGIVSANITMFIGYKLQGLKGIFAAMLGILFVPFLTIIILASILEFSVNNSYLQGAFWGVGIAVASLILLTVKEIWQNSSKDLFFYSMFFLALISLLFFKFSPTKAIILFCTVGIIAKTVKRYLEVNK